MENKSAMTVHDKKIADDKLETTGELTVVALKTFSMSQISKPEAIVRPLRRNSTDDNHQLDTKDFELLAINQYLKIEKTQKARKESTKYKILNNVSDLVL